MDFKQKYLKALEGQQYNNLLQIVFENFIEKFDYKSLSDLGTFLSDTGKAGATIKLTEANCVDLSKKMVEFSYFSNPDTKNAFALQLICLEREKDFDTVCKMYSSAVALKNCYILNNIAVSKYHSGANKEALEIQKSALKLCNNSDIKHQMAEYNLILYELFCDIKVNDNLKCTKDILNMLISDDIYDYYSAMGFAAYVNNRDFIENHLPFFNQTFIIPNNLILILNRFLKSGIKPSVAELKSILKPLTIYEDNFYLTS